MSICRYISNKLDGFEHGFFTRLGGISTGIFEGLNCGSGSKDDRDKIQFNRLLVAAEMNVNSEDLITVHQEHSARVVVLDSSFGLKYEWNITTYANDCIKILTRGF